MKREYKGQEKVKITDGEFKGQIGYVRLVDACKNLFIRLDSGYKTSVHQDCVAFIHPNYFLAGMENFLKTSS